MDANYSLARERMVEKQLAGRGIRDPRVLAAMEKVPRHLFVAEELRDQAYEDRPLPIGEDQTISQPYMVALMVEALGLTGKERVLEIGTGSGYEAAILSLLCAQVFSVEWSEDLAVLARHLLARLGYRNVSIHAGDGTLGWEEHAPYDAVIISAAAPRLPLPLMQQLKLEGSLVLPIGEKDLQSLVRIRKESGGLKEEHLGDCRFVKLLGAYGWED